MIVVNLPFLAAWMLFYFATSVPMLYGALVLTGFSGGLLEAPVLTYVAEITQPNLRGMLSATSSMSVILGVFIQFFLGNFLPWRTVAAVSAMFPVFAVAALCLVPESPHWLVGRGRVIDAERALCWLRGWVKPAHVQDELTEIVSSLNASEGDGGTKASWRSYTRPTFVRPFLLVSFAFFIGHFSGMTTLQTFAVTIFQSLNAPLDKYLATLYLGVVELAGALVCVVLIHWTGKRPLTFISTIGNGVCFIGVATYAYLGASVTWVPMALLLGAAFLSHTCIRMLPWILIGEVYPAEVRGVASGASGSMGYILGFATNKLYLHLLEGLGLAGTFWLYGGISLVGMVALYFCLPETEGRTLPEIQQHFAESRV